MGRPREFDEAEVLAAAIDCFWEHGYDATSVKTLTDKTGLTSASLYNAFGDKRARYHRALHHDIETRFAERALLQGMIRPALALLASSPSCSQETTS